ncbi:MAG TPA: hypothetical protein DEQ61_07725 [Streptomyces sp.]|nr:hypothetical protein [Streptomyces sp.]
MQCVQDVRVTKVITALRAEAFVPHGLLCGPQCSHALDWYQWETKVSTAFYELLRHLERVLGCAMSAQLTRHFGREDWYDHPGIGLHHVSRQKVENAIAKLSRGHSGAVKPDEVQSELALGFWVALLGRGNDYETRLWRPALCHAFPGYRGPRADLHRRLDYLRTLRNKVAHHRPIGARDLGADRRSVEQVLGHLSTDVAEWIEPAAAISALIDRKPLPCSQRLPAQRREN